MSKDAKNPKTNSEIFLLMERLIFYSLAFMGVYILDPNYTIYTFPLFFTVFCIIGSHSVCVIYTLFIYEQSSEMMLQTLAVSGVGAVVSLQRNILLLNNCYFIFMLTFLVFV